ncbi:transaldolase family protein [Streptomyces sp. NPDC006487]|uniref:transaldolase family protein n=1 Tax=Streptomyces sp. NPDC006487 TaxID=3364748 RepID=UPI0036842B69
MARAEPPRDGSVLRRLAAEGVSPWLEGMGRTGLAAGDLDRLATVAGVRGLLCDVDSVLADLDRTDVYDPELERGVASAVHGGARGERYDGPGELLEELVAGDARRACDILLPWYTAGDGADGLVVVPLAPWHADAGASAKTEAVRRLAHRVHRPNALVAVEATPEGLTAALRCLGEGLSVYCGPVFGVEAYEAVLDAWLAGLGLAHAAGLDLTRIAFVSGLHVTALGPAAVQVARLLYERADARYDDPRWPALVAAGARPHRLMWSGFDPATAAGTVPRLVGWGTGVALSGAALDAVAHGALLRGDTLSGTGPRARRDLDLADADPALAGAADRHSRACVAVWSRARDLLELRIRPGRVPVPEV